MKTPMLFTKKSQLPKGEMEWYNLKGKRVVVRKDMDADPSEGTVSNQTIQGTVVGTLGSGVDTEGDVSKFFFYVLLSENGVLYVFECVSDFELRLNPELKQYESESTVREWHLKEVMGLK